MRYRNLLVQWMPLLVLPQCLGFIAPTQCHRWTVRLFGSTDSNEPDLFDYFDPLRSPHSYPDGIGPDRNPGETKRTSETPPTTKEPMGLDLFRINFPGAFVSTPDIETAVLDPSQNKFATSSVEKSQEELDLFDVFDPTLSPHSYPNGIPSTRPRDRRTIGIVLMDHGSRSEASNQRLHELARLYQNSLGGSGSNRVIVKAAHMEIASPDIPTVLQSLVDARVDEIVCHPYFLSPGRHVKEDIPRIIDGAVAEFGWTVPITTTAPVGSHTDWMITAIHSLVQESSALLSTEKLGNRRIGF